MRFLRLIKPNWAKKTLANGSSNPDFVREINGENVIEGCNFQPEFVAQKNQEGYNIYFFPNHPSKDIYSEGAKYLNGRSIDVFNFVFVDMDLKDGVYKTKQDFLNTLLEFPVKPTMTIDSGNGIHAYWNIKDLNRDFYLITQRALIRYFKTDESVWTVLQLMRCPGYVNTKKVDNFIQTSVIENCSSNQQYSMNDIPAFIYENLTPEDKTKVKNHIDKLEGRTQVKLSSEVNLDEIPDSFIDLMAQNNTIDSLFNNPQEYGDRSSADMKLANLLFNKRYPKKEALQVLSNTQKALEKGPYRFEYAQSTVDKAYVDRTKNKFMTVSEMLRSGETSARGRLINGPSHMDSGVLGEPWRSGELLGVIAGTGVGKTAKALNIIKDTIQNNPNNDDVHIFYSLEMPMRGIVKRWIKLVGENSPLTDRLYVIDNYDVETGKPRNIGLQEMYEYASDISRSTGKKIGTVVIDHLHLISTRININKQPNFGINTEQGTGWGNMQNLSINKMAEQLKALVMMLDCFGIILTQTTKVKGVGDLPISKDGCYGISNYDWIMDRILTIWQPLYRVQNLTPFRFLAWQYAKIREKTELDKIVEQDPKLLTYDLSSGNLTLTNEEEYKVFMQYLPIADEKRKNLESKKGNSYSIQLNLADIESAVNRLKAVK